MKCLAPLSLALLLLAAGGVHAERPDHFEGLPAESLEQALANLSEYNRKLAALVAQDSLSPRDMHEVHQLTYTLENALEKLQDEVNTLVDVLEEVHVASETSDPETVKRQGAAYLQTMGILIP